MNKLPGINEQKFNLTFSENHFRKGDTITTGVYYRTYLKLIGRFFGIYQVWEVKILNKPKPVENGYWTYKAKYIRTKQYVFGIMIYKFKEKWD